MLAHIIMQVTTYIPSSAECVLDIMVIVERETGTSCNIQESVDEVHVE